MARLLYKLNGVPEDEAEDIRALLEAQHIEFYETSAGRWGISVAAIWIRDNDDLPRARAALDAYHVERQRSARAAYEKQVAEGTAETFLTRLRDDPLRIVLYLIAVLFIIALTVLPFALW